MSVHMLDKKSALTTALTAPAETTTAIPAWSGRRRIIGIAKLPAAMAIVQTNKNLIGIALTAITTTNAATIQVAGRAITAVI